MEVSGVFDDRRICARDFVYRDVGFDWGRVVRGDGGADDGGWFD